jgi:hypothetical protein
VDNKAQFSLEAVLAIGLAILIITGVFNIWISRRNLARDVGEAGEAKMIGILLAEGINNVYANGVNFSITLTDDEINYTRLALVDETEGGGMVLPIVIDKSQRKINITKDMSKTGGGSWTTQISIIPNDIDRLDPTSTYPETTIRNNGTGVIIYADSDSITVP